MIKSKFRKTNNILKMIFPFNRPEKLQKEDNINIRRERTECRTHKEMLKLYFIFLKTNFVRIAFFPMWNHIQSGYPIRYWYFSFGNRLGSYQLEIFGLNVALRKFWKRRGL